MIAPAHASILAAGAAREREEARVEPAQEFLERLHEVDALAVSAGRGEGHGIAEIAVVMCDGHGYWHIKTATGFERIRDHDVPSHWREIELS